jgi:hypothetical protein
MGGDGLAHLDASSESRFYDLDPARGRSRTSEEGKGTET